MPKISLRVELSDAGLPLSFKLRERTFTVRELLDSWLGTDHAYFRMIADDGNLYVIRHDLEENAWELVLMEVVPRTGRSQNERSG